MGLQANRAEWEYSPQRLSGQTRVVIAWKAVEYFGLALFIVVVPPMMGPERYGYFAATLSFIALLALGTGFGALQAFGRYLPEYYSRGQLEKVRELFSQFLVARTISVLLLAPILVIALPRLVDGASCLTVLAAGGAFALSVIGATFYQLLFGLNQLGKWRTYESLVTVVLVLLLLLLGGAEELDRALLALLAVHLIFFSLGAFWTRHQLTLHRPALDIASFVEHLRFGLLFFLGSLLIMAVWRGGEVLVLALSKDGAEVAYFSIANSIALTFGALVGQLTYMFVPSLTALRLAGEASQIEHFMGKILKYLTLLSSGFLVGILGVAPWLISTVMGERYLPVVGNLKLLGFALLPLGLLNLGLSSAVARGEPIPALRVSAAALAFFVAASVLLVPIFGSSGACLAMVAGIWGASLVAYFEFGLASVVALGHLWRILCAGLGGWAFTLLPIGPEVPRGVGALLVYLVSLVVLGAVDREDLRRLSVAVRGER